MEDTQISDKDKKKILVSVLKEGRNKFKAKKITIDGVIFASGKEGRRYQELKILEEKGLIKELIIHKRFPLHCITELGGKSFKPVASIEPDFCYKEFREKQFYPVVEEVKSKPTRTPLYRLKKKMFESEYGIQIREV